MNKSSSTHTRTALQPIKKIDSHGKELSMKSLLLGTQSLQSLPDFLNPLLHFLSAANHWEHSADRSKQEEGETEEMWDREREGGGGWLPKSRACHEWIYGWGDSSGRRANWWVTHNQPPYRCPAKLDCIQRLVIRPDLANVSHSSPEPRQLSVIRAWPGLPFPPSDCYTSAPPSTASSSSSTLSVSWHWVSGGEGAEVSTTKGLLTRFGCPPLLHANSLLPELF